MGSDFFILEEEKKKRREYHKNWRDKRTLEQKRRRKERQKNYHKEHIEEFRARRIERYKRDPGKQKKRWEYLRGRSIKKRSFILGLFGDRCVRCGFKDWRALQIDHIKGRGGEEKRLKGHSDRRGFLLEDVKKSPEKYQILCANCNWIKRYENNECIKRKEHLDAIA